MSAYRISEQPTHAPLEDALRRHVDGDIAFDPAHRSMYALDASKYYHVPIGVVAPRTTESLIAAVGVCRDHDVPLLLRGAGTSLSGQTCNAAVVIDTSRHLNRILDLDPAGGVARVQPGVVLDDLRTAAEKHGLTFGPDPSTHAWCTLGGMIGNNACGVHSVMAGRTVDNVEAMDVLAYDGLRLSVGRTSDEQWEQAIAMGGRRGQIYRDLRSLRDRYAELIRQRYPQIPRRVSGYNLDELLLERGGNIARSLVGTEGTCVTILDATVKLIASPPWRTLVILGFADVAVAADHVPEILTHKPISLEGMDGLLVRCIKERKIEPEGLKHLPAGEAWLFVEFGAATQKLANDHALAFMEAARKWDARPTMTLLEERRLCNSVADARGAAAGANARLPDGRDTWEGWEDAAVAPRDLGNYVRDYRALLIKHKLIGTIYGHFGDGLVHSRIDFQMTTPDGVARYRAFVEEASDLVVRYHGTLTGEHGDGQSRAELLPKMFGPELIEAFAEFKTIWDPQWKMNPGKVVKPQKLDADLRIGAGYALPQLQTHFQFPDDERNFGRAVARCVGVGKCRSEKGGVMCPSWRVTQEEMHCTRGRAHLLFDMAEGVLPGGWKNEQVKQALDLCLACKGCKKDCPSGVDVATYKAEFLAHYYQHHRRPMHAYALGWFHKWARLAESAPRFVNLLMRAPLLAPVMRRLAGVTPHRTLPTFAPRTFRRWFAGRPAAPDAGRPGVILWADTFNNHLTPEIAQAATRVLEAAGFRVIVPAARLCCGRPLYDYGMLDEARAMLRHILTALADDIRAGVPVVGLEPSCTAVFRDELVNLFPDDPAARALQQQTFTLAEFLQKYAPSFELPQLKGRKALYHGHCHHKAIMGLAPDVALMQRLGLDVTQPESSCCGMAGSFGYEAEHHDISMRIGERKLLPAVRAAESDETILLIADGLSCRQQIKAATTRRVYHLAEILALALDQSPTPASSTPR